MDLLILGMPLHPKNSNNDHARYKIAVFVSSDGSHRSKAMDKTVWWEWSSQPGPVEIRFFLLPLCQKAEIELEVAR